jgi:hypothetical protein
MWLALTNYVCLRVVLHNYWGESIRTILPHLYVRADARIEFAVLLLL